MTLLMMLPLLTSLTLILVTITQPLFFGLTMIFIVLFLSLLVSLTSSSWYAYIMFIIFVGGLLVMFAYVSALIPNELFYPPNLINFLFSIFLISFLLFNTFSFTTPLFNITNILSSTTMLKTASNLYFFINYPLILLLILVLLFILTLVVKICNIQLGPLRPFN